MTKAIENKRPVIYGDGSQSRDFVFVKDVVRANLLAAEASIASGEVFNIGTETAININQLWKTISGFNRLSLEPEFGPPRSGDIQASRADITKARRILGFEPEYSFEDGLRMTFEWYAQALLWNTYP